MKRGERAFGDPSVVTIAGAALGRRIAAALEADGVRVTGTARSPGDAASLSGRPPPDAVVVAVGDLSAEVRAEIFVTHRRFPKAKIVVVAGFPTPAELREALARGVDGVVLEDDVERSLAATVAAVCSGQIVVPATLRPSVVKPALSGREKQALAMVVMGFTNQEIARKLHVTESTVKSHLSSAFSKLGVRSRAQATQVILDPEHGLSTGILAISDDAELPG